MLTLEGRLDTTTAPVLETELKDAIEGAASLTFDLEKLEYISSAGLRVLLATQKSMNKQYLRAEHSRNWMPWTLRTRSFTPGVPARG